ncbi:tyrosine-protein phosphatase [Microaceticoccus formicicus]|uniref:tyrosine-protein phosphatase n=1 Tax=Microaceticoccus formicicus TaxID=3118105 RepID=UPI003CD00514|nr:CpsB/CapC family capsule biosynthesis tyrosine phosphatase [Peptoniphilaceae bacterium AMB_02]
MIDIHNHIIPGVDDGSVSIEDSMEMVKQYIASGYKGVICTSHHYPQKYDVTAEMIKDGIKLLNEECKKQGLVFSFYPGNEIYLDESTLTKLDKREISSLNGSRYVLIELPFLTKPHYARSLIYQLQLKGYIPILAHVERYKYVQDDLDWLLDFIKSGCLMQVNISSISRDKNSDEYKTIMTLLKRNMVHFIATDAHRSTWRTPEVSKELEMFRKVLGADEFQRVALVNPVKVISDEFISSAYEKIIFEEEKEKNKKPGVFARIFKRLGWGEK